MLNKKILFIFALILLAGAFGLWAGDTATFIDLGFSPDGGTYMFAQYGVQSETLKPWADIFIVDVPRNNFMPDGRISYIHDKPVVSGQDGSGALYHLLTRNAPLAQRYRIDHCFQGQPLYITLDNNIPAGQIEFRDFQSGATYRAAVVSTIEGSGASLVSSFYINLERTARDGSRKTYTVGTPQLKRPLIASYRISKVMIAPNDGSMIFVMEMRRVDGADVDIRYMVEAVRP